MRARGRRCGVRRNCVVFSRPLSTYVRAREIASVSRSRGPARLASGGGPGCGRRRTSAAGAQEDIPCPEKRRRGVPRQNRRDLCRDAEVPLVMLTLYCEPGALLYHDE